MDVTLELAILLALSVTGQSIFAAFELETAWWRKVLKWSVLTGLTLAGFVVVGHWTLVIPLAAGGLGLAFHVVWCRRHGIHPLTARPRRRYYRLRGWTWPDA